MTKQTIDITSSDPLFTFGVPDHNHQQLSLDPGDPPLVVTLRADGLLAAYRNDNRILQDIGNIFALSTIPPKQPSGRCARGLGVALQQEWRERAKLPADKAGRFEFQRRDLLNRYTLDPDHADLLASDVPNRARKYWDGAMQYLLGAVPGTEAVAKTVIEPTETLPRKGWQEPWLRQRVTIEPVATVEAQLDEIRRGYSSHIEAARPRVAAKKPKRARPRA